MTATVTLIENHPAYVAGNWYQPIFGTIAAGNALISANNIRLVPFFVPTTITISDLGCNVTTAASGGNCQLAIYDNDDTINAPTGNPLAVTGNISTTSTGAVSADITGANVQLTRGWYWMAIVLDTTAAAAAMFSTPGLAMVSMGYWLGDAALANVSPAGGATGMLRYSIANAGAYGTWPDLTNQTFTRANTLACGLVFYKVASVP